MAATCAYMMTPQVIAYEHLTGYDFLSSSLLTLLTALFLPAARRGAPWGLAAFAAVAAVLVVVQLSTAARTWGHLRGVVPLSDATAKQVHRWSGRFAILFTLPVVFHCVTILGFQTTTLRVAIHSIAGSFIYGVFVAKSMTAKCASKYEKEQAAGVTP